MPTAYFKSEAPRALQAPGGVLRWHQFIAESGDGTIGFLSTSNEPQIKFLRECVEKKVGGSIAELTEQEFNDQLGKSKGRSAPDPEREHFAPGGIRGGVSVPPQTAGVPPAAPVAASSPAPAPDPTTAPVTKSRRDIQRTQDPSP